MKTARLASTLCLLASFSLLTACDKEDADPNDTAAEETGDTDTDTDGTDSDATDSDATDTEDEGVDEDLDSDEDGLTDLEEEELGTDPNDKDTDNDNYWDSWEVIEGTDPLTSASRIYTGYWPYNPNKDLLPQGSVSTSTTDKGSPFPRKEFIDHHGDAVDIYDFSQYVNQEGQEAFMIVDLSAMWCGPCHNMADWIAGVDNAETAGLQQSYPTVRDKVHSLRIWWLTFIVEASDGSNPSQADAAMWYQLHQDQYIPVLVDDNKEILNIYNGGQFPFFFLLDPLMGIEHWSLPNPNDNPFLALFFVDQYL